jgi:hypothetical protein
MVPLVDILAHFHSVRMYPECGRLSAVELFLSALFLSIYVFLCYIEFCGFIVALIVGLFLNYRISVYIVYRIIDC